MKVKLSKKQIGILVAVVLLSVILIAGGVICVVKDETPVEVFNDIVYNNDEAIVGKWQVVDKNDIVAYEFFDDGTYKNYIVGLYFTGKYEIRGNKLALINPKAGKEIIYKIKISKDDMELTKKEEDGEKTEKEVFNYKRVDHINVKGLDDLLNDKRNERLEKEKNN